MRTLAGNGEAGFADGQFVRPGRQPTDVVVDKEGTIVVADHKNERLRKIVGRQVTTLAGRQAGGGRRDADGVFVVEGERFQMHRSVLAARSEYFRARFKSGMQDGGSKEVCYEDVSASAFRVLLRFLYAGELPAWEGGGGGSSRGRCSSPK